MKQDQWIDFNQIKEQISIAQVLKHYGVTLHRAGEEFRGKCPLPTHSSQSSVDSFSVNQSTNVWCCQSSSCRTSRDGKIGGSVLDLVAIMEQCSTREAALHLRDWFPVSTTLPDVASRTKITAPFIENPPLGFALRDIDHSHPYLRQRQISIATAQAFGIGFYPGPGLHHGRIVIPIRNVDHRLVAYAGRALDQEKPKYLLPPGFRKSSVLFNLDQARIASERTVVIVEGFFDAISLYQAGHCNVVALMGSSLSQAQADLLQKHFKRVVLMLDGDEAGHRASVTITKRLTSKLDVQAVHLQHGQQPDGLALEEINRLLGGAK